MALKQGAHASDDPPVIILGVSRSGTTLLKEMLDAHPQLAIPSESYFVPQLWQRHGDRPDRQAFLDDIGRIARIREWGISQEDIARRLPGQPSFPEAIAAIYGTYAEARGKRRFGDKTPAYMQRLPLLERAFPGAVYLHLIRDGRNAAISFLEMRRRPSFSWARPRGLASFAAQWRREVGAGRRFGNDRAAGRYRELRYETLVTDPEGTLREVCEFLEIDYAPAMLEYHLSLDADRGPDHRRLAGPPRTDARDWRRQMAPGEVKRFEAIAGELLADLGYEVNYPSPRPSARLRARFDRIALEARVTSFDVAVAIARKSPLWSIRHRGSDIS